MERYKQKTEIKIQGDIYIVILLFIFVIATAYISMRLSLIQNYISQLHKVTRPVCRSSEDRVTFFVRNCGIGRDVFCRCMEGIGEW